jgi:hypothetical protein
MEQSNAEFNIEKEIEKIENTVDKAVIKTVLFDQGESIASTSSLKISARS